MDLMRRHRMTKEFLSEITSERNRRSFLRGRATTGRGVMGQRTPRRFYLEEKWTSVLKQKKPSSRNGTG
jgi:hypothetical protein